MTLCFRPGKSPGFSDTSLGWMFSCAIFVILFCLHQVETLICFGHNLYQHPLSLDHDAVLSLTDVLVRYKEHLLGLQQVEIFSALLFWKTSGFFGHNLYQYPFSLDQYLLSCPLSLWGPVQITSTQHNDLRLIKH